MHNLNIKLAINVLLLCTYDNKYRTGLYVTLVDWDLIGIQYTSIIQVNLILTIYFLKYKHLFYEIYKQQLSFIINQSCSQNIVYSTITYILEKNIKILLFTTKFLKITYNYYYYIEKICEIKL